MIRPLLAMLAGVDICAIPGIKELSALELLAETGVDMSKWRTPGQFAAWLNLAPNTKKTGGKVINSKMMKKKNAAGRALRMAASTLWREKSKNGDYYRKIKAKAGGKAAVVATAHKLAKIVYAMIKGQKEYEIEKYTQDQERHRIQRIAQLERQIEKLKNAG